MEVDGGGQIEIREHISTDDEESLIQQLLGVSYAAGRSIIRLGFEILHTDAEVAPVTEVARDDFRLVEKSGDDVRNAVRFQQFDDVLHHRFVEHRNHRLGDVTRQRAQAGSEASRHDYRFH